MVPARPDLVTKAESVQQDSAVITYPEQLAQCTPPKTRKWADREPKVWNTLSKVTKKAKNEQFLHQVTMTICKARFTRGNENILNIVR